MILESLGRHCVIWCLSGKVLHEAYARQALSSTDAGRERMLVPIHEESGIAEAERQTHTDPCQRGEVSTWPDQGRWKHDLYR